MLTTETKSKANGETNSVTNHVVVDVELEEQAPATNGSVENQVERREGIQAGVVQIDENASSVAKHPKSPE